MRYLHLFLSLFVLAVASQEAICQTRTAYRITDLGTLGGDGSGAFGINNAGQVVGSSDTSRGIHHAFLWQSGKMRDLGTLGGPFSWASAVNERGKIVGHSETRRHEMHAFLWDHGHLTALPDLGGTESTATGLNDSGQVVGSFRAGGHVPHACLWDRHGLHRLCEGQAKASIAFGINAAGLIIGGVGYSGMNVPDHATVWIANRKVPLTPGPWRASWAHGINNRSQIVGYTEDGSRRQQFLAQPLSKQPAKFSSASWFVPRAINSTGTIVGADEMPSGAMEAIIRQNGKQYELSTLIPKASGWHLEWANGINEKGQIVGIGQHNGKSRAYLLTPH